MKYSVEDYVAKISNASPLQLVIINYEIILDYLDSSKECVDDDKKFTLYVNKAREFLAELRASLNMKYEISFQLMSLYNYVDQQISYYIFNKKEECVKNCENVLIPLLEGWRAIEKDETDKTPLMSNTQQIYAGLTYGRNGQLSEFVDTDVKRGFKA